MDASEKQQKKHVASKTGAKARKKIGKHTNNGQQNKKAFAIQKSVKTARYVQRTLDHQTTKYHLPTSERKVDIAPPLVVVVIGPPRSGKTTLLRSLLKHFARQTINVITGPVTVVAGKNMRLTFFECGCDINQMIDLSKVADIVLMVVNTRVGLEHYHYEFINLMQAHGMPRVVPVLNHLDTYKDNAASRDRRRKLKHRLWTDLNAKIFLLSKFIPHKAASKYDLGDYNLNEIKRLARLITVKVPRLTDWRVEHPYLLIDRLEDATDPKVLETDPEGNRSVLLYGWVRGATLPPALTSPGVHIIGLGDFVLADVTSQSDPCPHPKQLAALLAAGDDSKAKRRKYLTERDRKVYAPMSSLSGVLLDRDATYVDIGGSHHLRQKTELRPNSLLTQPGASYSALDAAHQTLRGTDRDLDEQLDEEAPKIAMMSGADSVLDKPSDNDSACHSHSEEEEEEEEEESSESVASVPESPRLMNVDGEDEEKSDLFAGMLKLPGAPEPKPRQSAKPSNADKKLPAHLHLKGAFDNLDFHRDTDGRINWAAFIYQNAPITVTGVQADDNTLCWLRGGRNGRPGGEVSVTDETAVPARDWTKPQVRNQIANRFTTGQWDENEDAAAVLRADSEAREALQKAQEEEARLKTSKRHHKNVEFVNVGADESSDDSMDGDADKDDLDMSEMDQDSMGSDVVASDDNEAAEEEEGEADPLKDYEKRLLRPNKREKLAEKRRRHRQLFENLLDKAQGGKMLEGGQAATLEFDKMMSRHQAQLAKNKEILDSLSEEARLALEGHPPGSYVRLQMNEVPSDFLQNFDPRQPLIIGGLAKCEESVGFLHSRFLTHRWSRRVLKSNDPVTLSIGWRRYQTIAVFSKEEHNLRKRYLKYSLNHEHCHMTFFGPLCAPKTGLIAFSNSAWRPQDEESRHFRVTGTGVVLDTNESFQIMKKLKLLGEPKKIFSKTAFIGGMFNSPLEVSKAIGAKIETASKIRGIIKAALTNDKTSRPGDFRATFEAPIRMADIVSLRTFVQVDLPKYYNPVLNILHPNGACVGVGGPANAWRMMRTTGELRRDLGDEFKAENRPDSHYRPVARKEFVSADLQIPLKLAAQLPYAAKPKTTRRELKRILKARQEDDPLTNNADIPAEVVPKTVEMDLLDKASDDQAGAMARVPQFNLVNQANRSELLHQLRAIHADFKMNKSQYKKMRQNKFLEAKRAEETERLQRDKLKRKQFFRAGGAAKLAKRRKTE